MKVIESWAVNEHKEIPLPCETEALYEEEIIRVAGVTKHQLDSIYDQFDDCPPDYWSVVGQVTRPQFGIKIGGDLRWRYFQGVEYPECPKCKVSMNVMFLQLEEDTAFSFMWGDEGTGHMTLCPHWTCS